MSLESELFARLRPDFSRFPAAGFVREAKKKRWRVRLDFMDGDFYADFFVTDGGDVSGRIYDADTGEPYLSAHIPSQTGAFVSSVREAYSAALLELAKKCFASHVFTSDQANRIAARIADELDAPAEHPFADDDRSTVFRDGRTRKWFALIMEIPRDRLVPGVKGSVEAMNVKAPETDVPDLWNEPGIYRCYHMNKKHWITVTLDDSLPDERVMALVRQSAAFAARGSSKKGGPAAAMEPNAWIVPANFKYWDVEKHFSEDPVHEWKQTAAVLPGDIAYMYIGAPVSAIWCKCEVLETDIPYDYSDANISIKKVMRLRMIRRYGRELVPLSLMKQFGVLAVRSTRRMTAELKAEIDRLEAETPAPTKKAGRKSRSRTKCST